MTDDPRHLDAPERPVPDLAAPQPSGDGHGDPPDLLLAPAATDVAAPRWLGRERLVRWATLAASVYLFVLAIQMAKEGASVLTPRLEGTVLVDNAVSTLGLGLVLAYVFLSGKPVAVFALVLFADGALSQLQAFTMLSGGRLGAAFIVLLVGFLYALRSRNNRESIGVGVLSLVLTAIVYVPGMFLGYGILKSGALESVRANGARLEGAVDVLWGPILDVVTDAMPLGVVLALGAVLIVASLKLIDRALPEFDGSARAEGKGDRFQRAWPMFLFGMIVTILTLSVSVALTVLVPLAAKGYITRREAIPYIMGSNLGTLADTLLVALLVGDPVGVQIVLAEAIGVAIVTMAFMLLAYPFLVRSALALDDWVVASSPRLWGFVGVLFFVPALLIGLGAWIGPTV